MQQHIQRHDTDGCNSTSRSGDDQNVGCDTDHSQQTVELSLRMQHCSENVICNTQYKEGSQLATGGKTSYVKNVLAESKNFGFDQERGFGRKSRIFWKLYQLCGICMCLSELADTWAVIRFLAVVPFSSTILAACRMKGHL